MSTTRRAEPGKPLRQERYCSSAEFERGLMANLVARRCEVISSGLERELVWFLQLLSHREGGLKKVAEDLVAMLPEKIATLSMQRFGMRNRQNYNAEQVKAVRDEIGEHRADFDFPLYGESSASEILEIMCSQTPHKSEKVIHPKFYPASVFVYCCREQLKGLPDLLQQICLDPSLELAECKPWYFPTLIESLFEFMARWIESRQKGIVITQIGKELCETLDYSLQGKCLTLIDGLARTGKTFAAKTWCELHPGKTRYVQVPSTSDEMGFFRAIARSLGVSINLKSKAQELRQRVEETLQLSGLMIVFDEAHYAWPTNNNREALPTRINWIMTALVNYGVPVSLVTTPQFIRNQKYVEKHTSWTSEQFIGRIGHYQKLPDSLPKEDLEAVAQVLLPEIDLHCVRGIVAYARTSLKYLAGIEHVARRARFLAGKNGRSKVQTTDVKRAISESVIPSDSALAISLAEPTGKNRRSGNLSSFVKAPLSDSQSPIEEALPSAGRGSAKALEHFPADRTQSARADRELVTG